MDPLFPELPEDLSGLSHEEVQALLDEHIEAAALIEKDDADFLKDLSGDEVIAQFTAGVEQIQRLRAAVAEHESAHAEYQAKKAELASQITAPEEETLEVTAEAEGEGEGDGDEDSGDEDSGEEAEKVEVVAEETSLVTASAPPRYSRTPPAPAPDRVPIVTEEETGTALVAAAGYREDHPGPLGPWDLALVQHSAIQEHGPAEKNGKKTYIDGPHGRAVFDGPKVKTARADFGFDSDHTLTGSDDDIEKIRNALPEYVTFFGQAGGLGGEALVASGGLCAPLTPIYSMPNFATEAEPVWDSLPVFRAARGGVNVPTATYIADITEAISSISEADDALGGTFATKSCQDLECPDYTETAVQILAHCREYGNLNARAWPEKIAHENALTMAALARTSEGFMLDRIKALSINVTNGAETLGALIYLVDAIVKTAFGIRGRLRMPREARFRALIPSWVPDMLVLDTIQTQFDRFRSREELVAYLRGVGIDPVFYLDTPSTGTTQLPDSAQTAAAIDPLPDNVQWAIYPEGAFIGVDMGVLELGIVRDSTLNSTNDFQVFGERFRNVARLAPAQAAYWVTSDVCAVGQFPPAGTARTCD